LLSRRRQTAAAREAPVSQQKEIFMDIEVVRRICLARHLFELGKSSLNSSNDLYLFSAANLMQDAVEAFLLAVADFVDASIDYNTFFDKYFVLINKQIDPKELPFKNKLLRLNSVHP
jgi:hypothetical protein